MERMAAANLHFPPGFRFHPTDEELVMHYLCRKCASQPISVPIIAEIDLYKFDPWDLPGKALYGEKEWYFFSPRDRKYPNGSRPNRAAGTGYWKATGADKPIGRPKPVAIKKALVFYAGKAPKGEKTNWIMHEYRLADVDRSARKKNNSLRLDDWVLCRIYNKKGAVEMQNSINKQPQNQQTTSMAFDYEDKKPEIFPPTQAISHTTTFNDCGHFDTMSDSVPPPRLHTESTTSCSEHVVSPCDKEVQSEPKWRDIDFDKTLDKTLSFPYNYMDASLDVYPFGAGVANEMSPLQDIFLYMEKPF